jgi:hypothetical protein
MRFMEIEDEQRSIRAAPPTELVPGRRTTNGCIAPRTRGARAHPAAAAASAARDRKEGTRAYGRPCRLETFSELDAAGWSSTLDHLRSEVRRAGTLEGAVQSVARGLHERFGESAVLARVYAMLRHRDLPGDVRAFVEGLGVAGLDDASPVLTLLGTHGSEAAWCDRTRSQGHKAIPLVSGAYVDAIPMIARLLSELGIDLSWLDEAPEIVTRRMLGGFNGTFYVHDAESARDGRGRRIIPAVEFVSRYGIKTVFGNGGFYPDGTLLSCIVFTREELSRASVERLASLISMLKGETFGLVRTRKLFEKRGPQS